MRSSERRESFVAGFDGRPFAHEIPPEVETYLKDVESGRKAFCRDQKRLAAYVRRCFAREEIYVHREQLRRYLSLQKYFPYDLFPWEVFYLALHLCTYYVADNTPRWDDLFLLVGRGSGKNGYLAFEDFCALSPYNGIRAYHIDICANNEDQARTSFDDIWRVLEDNREALSRHFTWNKEAITCRSTGAQLRFRTNSPRGKDGLRSGKVDFDEVHEYENYANIEVYTTGFGKKPHPRRTFITSNGFVRDGVLDAYLRRSEEILSGAAENAAPDAGKAPDSGGAPDSGWLPFLCRLDAPEEVDDPAMWHKANPSLEYLPALQREIRKEYAAYRRGESALSFLAKRMNVPRTDTELHVTDWENLVAASRPLPELTGRPCVVGIDYASMRDFAAAGCLFREGETRYFLPHAWLCLRSQDLPRIRAPWRDWARAGLLTAVDDVEIAPEHIARWLEEQGARYDIRRVALDLFRLPLLRRALKDVGFDVETPGKRLFLCRKSGEMKIAPVVESLFSRRNIVWGDNPLMRWAANNTKLERDRSTGNLSFGKIEPKSRKNDPFMALVAALQVEEELDAPAEMPLEDLEIFTF